MLRVPRVSNAIQENKFPLLNHLFLENIILDNLGKKCRKRIFSGIFSINKIYAFKILGQYWLTTDYLGAAYPSIIGQTNKLPLNKYMSQATKEFPRCSEDAAANDFENIISNSIRRSRHRVSISERSVKGIVADRRNSFEKTTRLIAHLEQNEINIDDLESYLQAVFLDNENILETATTAEKTNLRRLIRIYDYLKFAQK